MCDQCFHKIRFGQKRENSETVLNGFIKRLKKCKLQPKKLGVDHENDFVIALCKNGQATINF